MKKSKMSFVAAFLLAWVVPLCGCNPGGVKTYEEGAMDGYTFLCLVGLPISEATMLSPALIDMQGNEVNRYSVLGPFAKMLPGGSAIMGQGWWAFRLWRRIPWFRRHGTAPWNGPSRSGRITRDMGGRLECSAIRSGRATLSAIMLPNRILVPQGNTLVLAHADETRPEISARALLNDIIYEVDWAGRRFLSGTPWTISMNLGSMKRLQAEIYAIGGDWLHTTSMSRLGDNQWYDGGDTRFHPMNIIIGSANAGLIAIIDHQTGAVVWRVGPDYSQGMPEADLGPLINMHHAHMVPAGLPGEGNVLVFDNGGSSGYGGPDGGISKYTRDYSRVVEFDPTTYQIVWEYSPANGDPLPDSLSGTGSAQRLPNGNTLITSGCKGSCWKSPLTNRLCGNT